MKLDSRSRQAPIFFLAPLLAFLCCSPRSFADYYSSSYGRSGYYGSYKPPRYGPTVSLNLDPQESLNTSFRIAAREDRLKDLDGLLKKGAKINSQSDQGTTALMYASRNCSLSIVSRLLELNANVDIPDTHGRTALIHAIREDCTPVVQALLAKAGGDVITLVDHDGRNAFDYAGTSPIVLEMLSQKRRLFVSRARHHANSDRNGHRDGPRLSARSGKKNG